jgi:hypothetical protein
MAKYRKKPVVIEAIQYKEGYPLSVLDFVEHNATWSRETDIVMIHTLEGDMICSINDWIIKGVNGEFYSCKPDIFEKTYEKI